MGSTSVAISAASGFFGNNLALTKEGTVIEWRAHNGNSPNIVAGLSNVVAIAAGPDYGLALKRNGTVEAWSDHQTSATSVPAGLTNVVAIAAGGINGPPSSTFALALKADSTVVGWGEMNFRPVTVPEGLSNIVAIAAGEGYGLAITTNPAVAAKFQ
jgi:alpha-tubulin suppressor-like RCC1 family protein